MRLRPCAESRTGVERAARGGRRVPEPPHPFGDERILVVDDDPQTLRYVRDTLAAAGYAPIVTGDHRELAEVVRKERPQRGVLDLILPETDGIELMGSLPGPPDLPVIFISAYGGDETIARALEAGADDYIVQPFATTELTARIRAALHRRAEPEPFVLPRRAPRHPGPAASSSSPPANTNSCPCSRSRRGGSVDYASLQRQISDKEPRPQRAGSPENPRQEPPPQARRRGKDLACILTQRVSATACPAPAGRDPSRRPLVTCPTTSNSGSVTPTSRSRASPTFALDRPSTLLGGDADAWRSGPKPRTSGNRLGANGIP